MNNKLVIIIIFSILVSFTFADYGDITDLNKTYTQGTIGGGITTPWMIYGIIAVVISFMVSGIVYMIGHSLGMERIKHLAEAELLQAAASAVLVIMLIFLLDLAVQYTTKEILGKDSVVMCGEEFRNATEPIEFAKCKAQEKIYVLDSMYEEVYINNLGYERVGSRCWTVFGITVWCGDWNSNLRERIGQAHLLGQRIVPITTFLHVEYAILDYISKTMLIMFLPLGILFRIFPYTRGIGGIMIALAIGFYFVFPIMSVMIDPSYTRQDMINPDLYSFEDAEECYVGFSGTVTLMTNFLKIDEGGLGNVNYAEFSDRLSYLTLEAFYIPFMSLVVTLIFVRILSSLFGAEPSAMMRLVNKV